MAASAERFEAWARRRSDCRDSPDPSGACGASIVVGVRPGSPVPTAAAIVVVPTHELTDPPLEEVIGAQTRRSRAAYAQIHWRPAFAARRLKLTAAARYNKDSKDAERSESSNSTAPRRRMGKASDLRNRHRLPVLTPARFFRMSAESSGAWTAAESGNISACGGPSAYVHRATTFPNNKIQGQYLGGETLVAAIDQL